MLCPFCGKDIDDGSTFCPECNSSFEPPEGMDENLPSQVLYNGDKNHFPEDTLLDGSEESKKSSKVVSLAVTITIVTAVVLAIVFLSKPIAKKIKEIINQSKPVATASASIRKTLYETTSFTFDLKVKDIDSEEEKNIRIMVSYGENSDDTDFYFENGDIKLAIRDGICYKDGKTIDADEFFELIDGYVYEYTKQMTNGFGAQQVDSKAMFDALVSGKLSEEEFEKFFNAYGPIIFAYFMNTDANYLLPEYDDIQAICTQFLNGKVSKDAFEISEKDGNYEFTVHTEEFLTEFVEFAKGSDELSKHCEYWKLEENGNDVSKGIAYCAEEIPQITGTINTNADGIITGSNVKVGELYEVTVTFSDINGTKIDKELCESLTAASVE